MSVAREQPPVERIVRPFQDFAHKQSSGGILLIIAAEVAHQAPGEGSRGLTPGKEWAPWAST